MTRLQDFFPQERTAQLLLKSIRLERLHHAYLLHGENGVGKLALALSFARHLLCIKSTENACGNCPSCKKMERLQHPDLSFLFPTNSKDGKADVKAIEAGIEFYAANPYLQFRTQSVMNYFVDSIREIKSNSKFPPTEAPRRVILLHQIEYMNDAAANAFLKLLEEPPVHTIILMTTSKLDRILSTIKSRCQLLYLSNLRHKDIAKLLNHYQYPMDENDIRIRKANGNVRAVFEAIDNDRSEEKELLLNFLRFSIVLKPLEIAKLVAILSRSFSREQIDDFLQNMQYWFRDAKVLSLVKLKDVLINVDLEAELNKFIERYKDLDVLRTIYLIDETRQRLRQNAHVGMALTKLSIDINRDIKGIL